MAGFQSRVDSFQLILPSNSSMTIYEDNTLTNYTTFLPDDVELDGQWEVALTEIRYPHTWYTYKTDRKFTVQVINFEIETNQTEGSEMLDLESYVFTDIRHLIQSVNNLVRDALSSETSNPPSLSYDEIMCKTIMHDSVERSISLTAVTLNTDDRTTEPLRTTVFRSLVFNPALREALGFTELNYHTPGRSKTMRTVASNEVSLRNGFDNIYVYSDIVLPSVVGDVRAQLLKLVDIKGSPGENVCISYDKPPFLPLMKNNFRQIEILLKSDTGENIKFTSGKVIVTLQFRRQRLEL
jgi:hypothetical protein